MDLSYSYVKSFSYFRTNDPILGQFTSVNLLYLSKEFNELLKRSVIGKKIVTIDSISFVYSHVRLEYTHVRQCEKSEITDSRNRR